MAKERLDIVLVQKGLALDRAQAERLILAGVVWHAEQRLEKAGVKVATDLAIEVRDSGCRYVSRAGLKLEHALKIFPVPTQGRVCLDIGASTGGFTDCLLQHQAQHVIAVDVGRSQIDQRLKAHPQVTSIERFNARDLTREQLLQANALATEITLVCIDVSFISLRKLIEPVQRSLPHKAIDWVLLYKPQFELEPKWIARGGVVRDDAPISDSLSSLHQFLLSLGLMGSGEAVASPLAGKKSGNLEYLLHYRSV